MISLEGVYARARTERGEPDSRLTNVTFSWERGVLAVLGSPIDGTTALFQLLAGQIPARAGVALVAGAPPRDSLARIAYVPLEPALPDALRVEEVCALASRIRDEKPMTAAARLEPLGIGGLASREVRSLSRGESRAVSLAIALTSAATVLLIEEPLAGLDPSASPRVIEAVRARATAGAAVIVTTASVREATALADQLGVLTRGVFTHLSPSLAHVGPAGAQLRVVVAASAKTEVAPFVAALAEQPAITSIETAAFSTHPLPPAVAILVTGPELLALARAVGLAAARTGANVEAIESAVVPLAAIRARIAAPRPGMIQARPRPAEGSMPPGSAPPPPSAPPGGSA